MALFNPEANPAPHFDGTVVVLTGGASGIGRATIQKFHSHGALIVFGDIATENGEALASDLGERATFVPMDVTNYQDHLRLFKTALHKHGHIDHAISIAGITAEDPWFNKSLNIGDVESQPSTRLLDVNLVGAANFARVALPYLDPTGDGLSDSSSLTLISSMAGFTGFSHQMYTVSKHGVLGLFRSLCNSVAKRPSVRVNALCPNAVDTPLVAPVMERWRAMRLPESSAEYVATVIEAIATQNINGKAIYIEGEKAWDIEEGLWNTMEQWLGTEGADCIQTKFPKQLG